MQRDPTECGESRPVLEWVRRCGALSAVDKRLAAERIAIGVETYGTELKTHNGRDALQDVTEELVDALLYSAQAVMEFEDAFSAEWGAEGLAQVERNTLVWKMMESVAEALSIALLVKGKGRD